jgi:hypothetical protein
LGSYSHFTPLVYCCLFIFISALNKINILYNPDNVEKVSLINNNDNLRSILIGLLLGDGSLYKSSLTSNTRFEMSFGKNSEEFAFFIGDIFSNYMSNPVKSIKVKGKLNDYLNYRLKTKSLPFFNDYHNMFYKLNENSKFVKIVPVNIFELMDPLVLAFLIMSDGNFDNSRNRVRIYTNNFNYEEVVNLSQAIYSKFGIYTGVLRDRENQ